MLILKAGKKAKDVEKYKDKQKEQAKEGKKFASLPVTKEGNIDEVIYEAEGEEEEEAEEEPRVPEHRKSKRVA